MTNQVKQELVRVPAKFPSLNNALGGGLPEGRLLEIYGPSQMGKTLLCISMVEDTPTVIFDVDRKLTGNYLNKIDTNNNLIINQDINNDELFDATEELIKLDGIVIIDSLPLLGDHLNGDSERFKWLTSRFSRVQRLLLKTKSIVIVINGIRSNPATGATYNPHAGVLDPAVRIKMHTADNTPDKYRLVYLDIEHNFWNKESTRCTLRVFKNEIKERR